MGTMDYVERKLSRPPSVQHTLALIGKTAEETKKEIVEFIRGRPPNIYPLSRAVCECVFGNKLGDISATLQFVEKQIRAHKNEDQSMAASRVIKRIRGLAEKYSPRWCTSLDADHFSITPSLRVPVNPIGLIKKADGSLVVLWIIFWKEKNLSADAMRALATILRQRVDQSVGSDVEVEIVDLSDQAVGSLSDGKVIRAADLNLMTQDELASFFAPFVEGLDLARRYFAEHPEKKPKPRRQRPRDDGQLPLDI
jgi:hypothetical protein